MIWLSITGIIYVFKPQIESWIDRQYADLSFQQGPLASPESVTRAAAAAVPGSSLSAYEVTSGGRNAVQILVKQGQSIFRVYVHPQNLKILKVIPEEERFMRIIFRLHGELLMGDRGSMIVELAASWAIVLLITGLYLWWPESIPGRRSPLAGVIYPRLKTLKVNRRTFWRDMHAVTGFWVSLFALLLLLSGLPWTKSWGGMLKQIRQIGTEAEVKQDWSTSSSEHMSHSDSHSKQTSGDLDPKQNHDSLMYSSLNILVPAAAELHLAPPVLAQPADSK